MTKKTALIVIIAFVLLAAGAFAVFYFYYNHGGGNNVTGTEPRGNIFPAGSAGGAQNQTGGTPSNTSGQQIAAGGAQAAPVLKELSTRPSAGAVATATTSPQSPLVRFVERGTGNVYEVTPLDNSENRLSNTTIPKIEEALWNKDGTRVIVRYAGDDGDSITSYSAALADKSASEPEGVLKGTFLSDNIRAMAANPDQNKIFYLLQNSSGSTGLMAQFDGTLKNQIFDSLLKEWLVSWPAPNLVALTTKPSAGVPGFLYILNTKTGGLTRTISGVSGLSALVDPTGATALYSQNGSQGVVLKIYSFKNASARDVSVATLPEKCVWSKNDLGALYCGVPTYLPAANYPDDWYKGVVAFSDEVWKVDGQTGAGTLLAKLKNYTSKDIDAVNLFMDPKEDYLFFTNKNDFHLWSLRLAP